MTSRRLSCITAMTLFAALAIPPLAAQRTRFRHYKLTDLGTLGGTFSWAYGLNERGSVVGYANLTGDIALHAFLWRDGVMTDLGALASPDNSPVSAAYSINDDDEVVGVSETSTPDPNGLDSCNFGNFLVCLPVLWRNGAMTALPTFGGPDGQASSINNDGQVVGVAQSDKTDPLCHNPVLKPTVWERGHARALPTAPFLDGIVGGAPGPAGNNDRGQVVGIVLKCDGSAALLWRKHEVIDMGTIAGALPVPVSVNDKGQAVGTYTTTDGINHAFLWQDGIATDLGRLPGDAFAEGNGVNDHGQVVGESCRPTGCNGFLWQNGVMTNLDALAPDASLRAVDAMAINGRGQIVGVGLQKTSGEAHAFLAMPCNDEHENDKGCEDQSTSAPQETARA